MKKLWSKIKKIFHGLDKHRDVISDVMKNRHRFVVMDQETYKEKMAFQLTGINLFVTIGIIIIVFVLLTFLLIAFTPLRELIPGYTNTKMTQQTYQNAVLVDSLEQKLVSQEQQLQDIKAIMMGQDPEGFHRNVVDSATQDNKKKKDKDEKSGKYYRSKDDSLLRVEVESADKYSLRVASRGKTSKPRATVAEESTPISMQLFFTPIKGTIVAQYNPRIKHYGVDIAGAENESVKAVMSGTVIFSDFTVETGYVIAIQHPGNYISVYKHNSALLKHDGDLVRAGEPIAFLGNSGELTSGPHLHFELWQNGMAVNPVRYISF